MENLMKRIEKLEAIAEIQKLQGKYYRCLDTKAWDEMAEVFAPEIDTAFSDGRLVFKYYSGEGGLREFYEREMNSTNQISQHNGHTPEIEVADDCMTAHGKWYLHDYLIIVPYSMNIRGTAIYDIDYVKIDGVWKIYKIGYKRIYEENWRRIKDGKYFVTENMFVEGKHKGMISIDGSTEMKK